MYEKLSLGDLEKRTFDEDGPSLKAVGYELRPQKMRPALWVFEAGETGRHHRQEEQEELYLVLEGRIEMTVEDETVELEAGDVVVVPPESWRQLSALEHSEVFVVGAPNVKDDGVLSDE